MGIEGKRFGDGVIDISSLRAKKEKEKEKEKFDAEAILNSMPNLFVNEAAGATVEVVSAFVLEQNRVYVILQEITENDEGEKVDINEPFVLIAPHDGKVVLIEEMRVTTNEEFAEFQEILAEVSAEYQEQQTEESADETTENEN